MKTVRHLLTTNDISAEEVREIFKITKQIKKKPVSYLSKLRGKTMGLIFEKPSTRTWISFQAGMAQLGGSAVYLGPEDIHLGRREAIKDVARVLSRYLDIMVYRTFAHNRVEEFSKYSSVPVINGLSDFSHPCQALTDFFTIEEKLGSLKNLKLAYVGDANNVFASLLALSVKMGITFSYATPEEYAPDEKNIKQKRELAKQTGATIEGTSQPEEAVKNADVVYTDVWVSMGQEENAVEKRKKFVNYQVSLPLLKKAKPNVMFMHCLPARRGEEITDEVLESKHSIVFDQAENRMHVQKALLLKLLGK